MFLLYEYILSLFVHLSLYVCVVNETVCQFWLRVYVVLFWQKQREENKDRGYLSPGHTYVRYQSCGHWLTPLFVRKFVDSLQNELIKGQRSNHGCT